MRFSSFRVLEEAAALESVDVRVIRDVSILHEFAGPVESPAIIRTDNVEKWEI